MNNVNCRRWGILTLALLAGLCLIASPSSLFAHGVSWSLSSKKTYGLEFTFDDGSPMAFAEIKIYMPGDEEILSQTGRTDKNGYFAFLPSAEGEWTVKANDGTGHLAQAKVNVVAESSEAAAAPAGASAADMERAITKATKPFKIAIVISVFLNLAAFASIFRRKKREA